MSEYPNAAQAAPTPGVTTIAAGEVAEHIAAYREAWNEAHCCDDINLDQPLAGVIADLQKDRERRWADIEDARRTLAAWDINSLPTDMSLLALCEARIDDLRKFMDRAEAANRFFWVIELDERPNVPPAPRYWSGWGTGWVYEIDKAIQFVRKSDAEQILSGTRILGVVKQHGYLLTANPRSAATALETLQRQLSEAREALDEARKRMRNCRGAIESNQVVDKDVHGGLTRGMADIDAALASIGRTP